MSNHNGSYMLNEVLELLEEKHFFEKLTVEEKHDFILQIIKIGDENDCNPGEILEDIGERLGICYYCLEISDSFENGLCPSCR